MGHIVKRPYKEGVGDKPTTKKPSVVPVLRYGRVLSQRPADWKPAVKPPEPDKEKS